MRGRIAVFPLERSGKIFFIREAAQDGNLLHRVMIFHQKPHCLIHAKPDDILHGGDAELLKKHSLQTRYADKSLSANRTNIQRGITKMRLNILKTIRKLRTRYPRVFFLFQLIKDSVQGGFCPIDRPSLLPLLIHLMKQQ